MYSLANWFNNNASWLSDFVLPTAIYAPLALLLVNEMGVPTLVTNDLFIATAGLSLAGVSVVTFWIGFFATELTVLAGASVLFMLGKQWGAWLVAKLGRFLFIRPVHIERAEKMLEKHGIWAIIVGRHLPGVRLPLTIFAAAAGVTYRTFILGTLVSTIPWVLLYLHLGQRYGTDIQQIAGKYTGYSVVIAGTIVVVLLLLHFWKPTHKNPTPKQ